MGELSILAVEAGNMEEEKKQCITAFLKSRIEALTIATAKICAPYKILVNAIRPGATKTNFHKKMGRKNLKKRTSLVPLKRMASTNEISNAVIFLCSEKSTFITNSILDVRGGE